MQAACIVHVHNRISMAFCSHSEATEGSWSGSEKMHFFTASEGLEETDSVFDPIPLEFITIFAERMHLFLRTYPGKRIVACVGKNDAVLLTRTAVLLGGFMILGQGLGFEEVKMSFTTYASRFITFSHSSEEDYCMLSVDDFLRTLCRAKCLGWIDLTHIAHPQNTACDEVGTFAVDEFAHYARPENGAVLHIVPDLLMLFPSPADLPKGVPWRDTCSCPAAGGRLFGPTYFADLFADLHVSRALCPAARRDVREAFQSHGICVDYFGLDCAIACALYTHSQSAAEGEPVGQLSPEDAAALATVNHLLDLCFAGGGGRVAVCVGGPDGVGCAGLLAAAALVSEFGFEPRWAAAWVRMLRPKLLCPAHARLLLTLVRASPVPAATAARRTSAKGKADGPAGMAVDSAAALAGSVAEGKGGTPPHSSSSPPKWFFERAASVAADLFGRVGSAASAYSDSDVFGVRRCDRRHS